jgi:transmembrane sensor
MKTTNRKLPAQILDEATEWFIEYGEGTLGQHQHVEFVNWLRASPDHVRAYLKISAVWEHTAHLKKRLTTDELIRLARSDVNVVPLTSLTLSRPENVQSTIPEAPASPRRRRGPTFALAASFLIATAGLSAWFLTQREVYSTGIGEHRSIRLVDGSTVDLNSRSRVRISFEDSERDVELLEGQALFRVAKDPTRPFIVRSGDTRVRAVGTQFDVYRRKSGTTVTVIEGRVVVTPGGIAGRSEGVSQSEVGAGEQLTLTTSAAPLPVHADVSIATAWTQRKIVFQSTPLSEVVEEFNRYNARQMIVADPRLEATRISGVFSSTDPTSLLRFLRSLPAFTVHEDSDEIRISGK